MPPVPERFSLLLPRSNAGSCQKVDGGAGILTSSRTSGDVMNFEMATELARTEGIRVLNILIDD